jgi:hypothetical protein
MPFVMKDGTTSERDHRQSLEVTHLMGRAEVQDIRLTQAAPND